MVRREGEAGMLRVLCYNALPLFYFYFIYVFGKLFDLFFFFAPFVVARRISARDCHSSLDNACAARLWRRWR